LNAARLIKLTAAWGIVSVTLAGVVLVQAASPAQRAVFGMGFGLIGIWSVIGGLLQVRFREAVRRQVRRIPLDWRVTFVLFCIVMAMLEEAVTVTMTNLAPLFGVGYGEAYITASGHYLDVILFHSVVAFVPMFVGWAWLLARYDFSPGAVFLLFGLTGTIGEAGFAGAQQLINFGFWVFVYGLMVYLPVYSIPRDRGAKPPRWWHYPLGVLFPYLSAMFYLGVLWALSAVFSIPVHPPIHFPPIRP
jgi:hypothetical protein